MLLGSTKWSGALLALLLVAPAYAQTLAIEPAVAKPGQAIVGTLSAVPDLPDGAIDVQVALTLEGGDARECNACTLYFWHGPGKGLATWKRTAKLPTYELYLVPGPTWETNKADVEVKKRVVSETVIEQTATATVEVEGGAPPVPPEPPKPPAPIADAGLRVLVVYDPNGKGLMPREQLALVDSPTFRAYLDEHCVKVGKVPEWRIAPVGKQFPGQPLWQKAMDLPRAGVPWLVVSNGTNGESVPLPLNEAAAIALIGRYAK